MTNKKSRTVPARIENHHPVSRPSFDYGSVDARVASFLKGQANRIGRQWVVSAVQIGKLLIGAKHYLSHGQFLCWIESEVGISGRTAQLYMRAAEWASGKSETVSHLQPSILYLLSAPSTPEELRIQMLKRIDNGEKIAPALIRAELRRLRNSEIDSQGSAPPISPACAGTEPQQVYGKGDAALADAIKILSSELHPSTFARVRRILTSAKVLSQPRLADKILAAFADADGILGAVGKAACELSELAPF